MTSCWSLANTLRCAVPSITGTPPPQRGLVIPAPSTVKPTDCRTPFDRAVCLQPAGGDVRPPVTCWWFTAADSSWWSR